MACSQQSKLEADFERLAERSANLLSQDYNALNRPKLIAPPANNTIKQPTPSFELSLVKGMSITECGLQQFIGERNSSLGKLQDNSKRALYELTLHSKLNQCDFTASNHNTLLEQLKQHKNQYVLAVFDNLVSTSKEIKNSMNFAQSIPDIEGIKTSKQNAEQLQILATSKAILLKQGYLTAEQIEKVKNAIFQLNNSQLGGFLKANETMLNALQRQTELMEQGLSNLRCSATYQDKKAQYLKNVFFKYYAIDIQSYMAASQQTHLKLISAATLWDNTPFAQSAFYKRYYTNQDLSLYQAIAKQTKQHTAAWQAFFKQCQFSPQSPRS